MPPRKSFNLKRRIRPNGLAVRGGVDLGRSPRYVGSPLHKRSPADFGLNPPAAPRPSKTLCDGIVTERRVAQDLLSRGFSRGLISVQMRNEWPQNIWAVTDSGVALEAQLDNEEQGTYHGYPMTQDDPLREEVILRWNLI